MIHVARYSVTGPFAGRIVHLRKVQGRQQWTVKVTVTRPLGQEEIEAAKQLLMPGEPVPTHKTDEHLIPSPTRLDLGEIQQIVFAQITELIAKDEVVNDASLDFYIAGTKKKGRR